MTLVLYPVTEDQQRKESLQSMDRCQRSLCPEAPVSLAPKMPMVSTCGFRQQKSLTVSRRKWVHYVIFGSQQHHYQLGEKQVQGQASRKNAPTILQSWSEGETTITADENSVPGTGHLYCMHCCLVSQVPIPLGSPGRAGLLTLCTCSSPEQSLMWMCIMTELGHSPVLQLQKKLGVSVTILRMQG